MRALMLVWLFLSFSIAAQTQTTLNACDPSPEVKQSLKLLNFGSGLLIEKVAQAKKPILAQLLQRYPDDLFVHMEARQTAISTAEQTVVMEQYRRLAENRPNSLQYKYLYARVLVDIDTPKAMDLLKQLVAADPASPWPYLELAWVHDGGKYADFPQFRAELAKFYEICPGSLNWEALSLLLQHGSPEMAVHYAPTLRRRLTTETDRDDLRSSWKTVWKLEFKAIPVAGHTRLRKQILKDLARLREMPGEANAKWLAFLEAGYKLADNPEAAEVIEADLLARYPESQQAKSILDQLWWREHPWPKPDDQNDATKTFFRLLVQHQDQLLKESPTDSLLLLTRFIALAEIDGIGPEELTQAADRLLNALTDDPIWQASSPVNFQIAQAFVKTGVSMDRVPQLVEEGLRLERDHEWRSDTDTEEAKEGRDDWNLGLQTEAADILVGAAKKLQKPDIARNAVLDLNKQIPHRTADRSAILAVNAAFAELEGRQLDAFLMYQAAVESRPLSPGLTKTDELAENEERLWKELGGSPASRNLWDKKSTKVKRGTEELWEIPNKAMPSWKLNDLHGHMWKMASLKGKMVLIATWAAGCEACPLELSTLQKIYDEMKGRQDVQVLSFNSDREISKVVPYVHHERYTFPVLLANGHVDDLMSDYSVPQIWIVDSRGKWRWKLDLLDPNLANLHETVLSKLEAARSPY